MPHDFSPKAELTMRLKFSFLPNHIPLFFKALGKKKKKGSKKAITAKRSFNRPTSLLPSPSVACFFVKTARNRNKASLSVNKKPILVAKQYKSNPQMFFVCVQHNYTLLCMLHMPLAHQATTGRKTGKSELHIKSRHSSSACTIGS